MFKTMLVEDNLIFRESFRDRLQLQFPSMEIAESGNGVEALEKIASFFPNLIFMDIRLPGENGLELTRKIKTDHSDIIVIIFTSYDLLEYREAATQNKANYFFTKSSITSDEIFALVKKVLLEKGFNANGSTSTGATA